MIRIPTVSYLNATPTVVSGFNKTTLAADESDFEHPSLPNDANMEYWEIDTSGAQPFAKRKQQSEIDSIEQGKTDAIAADAAVRASAKAEIGQQASLIELGKRVDDLVNILQQEGVIPK